MLGRAKFGLTTFFGSLTSTFANLLHFKLSPTQEISVASAHLHVHRSPAEGGGLHLHRHKVLQLLLSLISITCFLGIQLMNSDVFLTPDLEHVLV